MAKLTVQDIAAIGARLEDGATMREVARDFDVTVGRISQLFPGRWGKRRRWGELPHSISFKLNDELYRRLRGTAFRAGLPLGEWLRRIVDQETRK